MVRHAPIHRRSGHSDIAICCGRNVRGSSPSTSVVPLSNQVTTLNHKRFKGFKMFSDGHLASKSKYLAQINKSLDEGRATKKHSAAGRKGPNSTSIRSANLPRPSMAGAFSLLTDPR